jgi:hypothetical protein
LSAMNAQEEGHKSHAIHRIASIRFQWKLEFSKEINTKTDNYGSTVIHVRKNSRRKSGNVRYVGSKKQNLS